MPHPSPVVLRAVAEIPPQPAAFRRFIEGMESFQDYLRSDSGEDLVAARSAFAAAAAADPLFALTRFHEAVALAHSRKEDDAIKILETLSRDGALFLPEVYYNLAQAYLHTYPFAEVSEATRTFDTAARLADEKGLRYLTYLARASKVLAYGVLGGRVLRHGDDFEQRVARYLPEGEALGQAFFSWRGRLRLLMLNASEASAVRLEANNGLGVVYMRMGQHAKRLNRDQDEMWRRSEECFKACLRMVPTLTPALQNFGTLHRLQGERWWRSGDLVRARAHFTTAREHFRSSLRINPYDQFPHYSAAACSAFLDDWTAASLYYSQGREQPGQVGDDLWETLKEAIAAKDPNRIAPEESGES